MTQRSFKVALAKGEVGEMVVRSHLERKGWIVYKPHTEGAHAFDILAILNKKSAIAIDVKAKSRMNKYPATGINQKHFEEYKAFSDKHNMPFWVVFVDESQRTVYGNTLSELEIPRMVGGQKYPFLMPTGYSPVRLWPLEAMKHIARLDDAVVLQLADLSQRSYAYEVPA